MCLFFHNVFLNRNGVGEGCVRNLVVTIRGACRNGMRTFCVGVTRIRKVKIITIYHVVCRCLQSRFRYHLLVITVRRRPGKGNFTLRDFKRIIIGSNRIVTKLRTFGVGYTNFIRTNVFCRSYLAVLIGYVGDIFQYFCFRIRRSQATNGIAKVVRANYKWNKFESLDNNIYSLNNFSNNEFNDIYSYSLVLYTSNYDCNEKFNKIIIKEYDFNKELSNEKTIYTGKWFKQIELNIETNKIYVYELHFKDGDYVQYTFNTKCN